MNSKSNISVVDRNLNDILDMERNFLLKIFECKDNIDAEIIKISIHEKKDETQKELLDNLVDWRRNLFKKFFINYCKNKNLLEHNEIFSDDDERYAQLDEVVRYNVWVKIFNEVKKDNILNFVYDPLEFDGIYPFIHDFLSEFLDSVNDLLVSVLPEWSDDELEHNFVWYFKDKVLSLIKLKISDINWEFDLDALFDFLSDVLYNSLDIDNLSQISDEYLMKNNEPWGSEDLVDGETLWIVESVDGIDDSGVNLVKNNNEDVEDQKDNVEDVHDNVVLRVKQLVDGTYLKDYILFEEFDFNSFDSEKIKNDAWNFLIKNWIFFQFLDPFDYDNFEKNFSNLFLSDEHFDIWRRLFFKRVSFPISTWDLKISTTKDSDNIMSFIYLMKEKYPKAKAHVWNLGVHKMKDKQNEFLEPYEKKFFNELSDIINGEWFRNLSIEALFKIMYAYEWLLKLCKFDLSHDFEDYLKKYIEQCFVESDQSIRDREQEKLSRKVEPKIVKESESVVEEQAEAAPVSKKDELSQELLEDLDFYFTQIDTSFSAEERAAILKIIAKIPWKCYRRKWFKDYNLSDIFFQNLDKNWYRCDDELSEDENSQLVEVTENPVNPEWVIWVNQNSEVDNFISDMDKLDDITLKIDRCFDALKDLWYSFYRKEWKLKEKIIDICKSNNAFFTGFSSTIINLLRWSQVDEKKWQKWQGMPVYCIDIWGTWYRLVCLLQWDGKTKAIYDIMVHKAYITFLDKKCN